jgi:hypothetical protein
MSFLASYNTAISLFIKLYRIFSVTPVLISDRTGHVLACEDVNIRDHIIRRRVYVYVLILFGVVVSRDFGQTVAGFCAKNLKR